MRPTAASLTGAVAGLATVLLSLAGAGFFTLLAPKGVLVPSELFASYGAAALGAAAIVLSIRRTGRPTRLVSLAIASAVITISVGAVVAHIAWPASALAVLDAARPLHGIVLDVAAIALLLATLDRAPLLSNAMALLIGTIGLAVTLGTAYGGPLVVRVLGLPFWSPSGMASIAFAIALFASNGPAVWPTTLIVGPSVAATLRRWFLPIVALCVILTDYLTVRIFSGFSPAFGSTINTLVTVFIASAVVSYVGRVIGARLDSSYVALRESEASLSRSERQFRELFERVRDVVFSVDAAGNITTLNPAFESMTGFAVADWTGRPFIELIHPDDRVRASERFGDTLNGGQIENISLRMLSRDGGYRLGEFNVSARVEAGGSVSLFGIARDVSDRVRLEGQLRQAQKMDAIGRLAGGVAHDFNNLLMVIIGWGELLLGRMAPDRPERTEIGDMVKAARRGADLTRQLLAFSRQQPTEVRDVSLNSVIDDVQRMLKRMIGDDVTLETTLDPAVGIMRGDPGQIEQLLVNLVINARDALPTGGHVRIATSNVVIDSSFAAARPGIRPGRYVRIRVSDTGTGMAPDVAARIFEPFFTTKDVGKGTGLGLATVFGIVQQHDGHVTLDTVHGRGSIFDVYFPRVDVAGVEGEEADAPATIESSDAAPAGTQSILVVDDDEAVRAVTTRALRQHGYHVLEAASGAEALTLARAYERAYERVFDLAVVDVVMPGMNGPELADELKRMRDGLQILFVSGYAEEALIRHGVAAEDVELLHKPFAPSQLVERVGRLLAGDAIAG